MSLTKDSIAKQIDTLLGFHHYSKCGPTYNAVKAVFKVMTDALQRGESVFIRGFGTFHVKQYESYELPCMYFYKGSASPTVTTVPAKKRVLFTPSKSLKYYVNHKTYAD